MKLFKNPKAESLELAIEGKIDEDALLEEMNHIPVRKVFINLGKLHSINSSGIRKWINWMSSFEDREIFIHEAPRFFIDQANMVSEFLTSKTKVLSFYLPFFSENTEEEKSVLVETKSALSSGKFQMPEDVKDSNGELMEVDVNLSKYLAFTKNHS